ncbi:agarase [Agaribacter marinus]|uniref:Hydrolase n=1 Tax=Agaribacter marinus TaxID=1431249 RepID=A0AA37T1I4_9ALTE|nr:agarase [Agaribacter marinus]GLR71846.1 hydrolase [Agaribacter marinus]
MIQCSKKRIDLSTILFTAVFFLFSCSQESKPVDNINVLISDFEELSILNDIDVLNANISVVKSTLGNKSLHIQFSTEHTNSGITIKPEKPWNTENLGDNAFMFDVKNPSDEPVMLTVAITNANGQSQRRTIGIDKNEVTGLYFELKGFELNVNRGLYDTPPTFDTTSRKMPIRGSKLTLDFNEIHAIKIYTEKQIRRTEVIIDNLRIETTPPANKAYLANVMDKFGQRADMAFDLKVSSEEELKAYADKELAQLNAFEGWSNRSKFGGWKNGPRLDATGYFRVEKVENTWSLIDPEGYLYFSSGIANARMSNTSTFTGIDYKDDSVRYIDPNDVTPEDSQGISGNYREAQKTSFIANQQRREMFEWLPEYNHPLANHYGYRRKAHLGPMPHGEVFSFYQANLERRYGESSPDSYLNDWHDVTLKRMNNWGFTSFGNWTDPMFYNNKKMPYFANGWIIGEFKTLSSGFDIWGEMPDVFDPEFTRRAKITAQVISDEIQSSPWCVGIFIDNEMSWGGPAPYVRRYGIVLDALSRSSQDSPTKAVFVEMLKDKYQDINLLNAKWNKNLSSWQQLSEGVDYKNDETFSEALLADVSWLLTTYAEKYFEVVNNAVKEFMPNHMYMGNRFTTWGTAPEAHYAAKKYADVVSFNYYGEGIDNMTFGFLKNLDAPVIIGEYHIGASDVGHPNPGKILAANQKVRADMFKHYLNSAIDNPYIVGAHWFQYIDSPLTGRAHDGENYNVGFVTMTDIPFPYMVNAAKEVHSNMYLRRFTEEKK